MYKSIERGVFVLFYSSCVFGDLFLMYPNSSAGANCWYNDDNS